MSGIAGYWGYSSGDFPAAQFASFIHSLTHRGPDGFGIEHFPAARLWLGHRHLAVTNPFEYVRQPTAYADGRYRLVYDSEIYNAAELREELRGRGYDCSAPPRHQ
jgi:asparagine synthase (glutamine-hydrolysing)